MNVPQDNHYKRLLEEIERIAQACGRNPLDITLLAVSKTHGWEEIAPIYRAGCRDFGENRIQEALGKIENTPADIRWHFIGPLQKNKVNKVVGTFTLIHSVDSIDLAKKIAQASTERGVVSSVLLEVNTSQEPSKHGFHGEELQAAFKQLTDLKGISFEGLMTMAPFTQDDKVIRRCFSELRLIRDLLKEKNCLNAPMHHLSMGMSNDYQIAIEEGATLIRVGTALFN